MVLSRVYFDHNATTPIHPAARAAMQAAFGCVGNPSSIHAEGRAARALLDEARRDVAALVGVEADDVFFTSGGTEALNAVLTPEIASAAGPIEVLLVGATEHAAVLAGHRFAPGDVVVVAVTKDGVLDLAALEDALRACAPKRAMLALQAANNETGVIQPVREAAALVHAHGGFLVCDAVQAAGKIACDIGRLGADALVLSAHKFGGPKGVGALIFAPSGYHLKRGVIRGGGQERGLRSGTENVPGIAGLGAAAVVAKAAETQTEQWVSWRGEIERMVSGSTEATIFGGAVERLPNTVNVAVHGVEAQVLLMKLDLAGVAVSTGSACSSGKVKPSHVLAAMAVPPSLARTAIRISLGWTTTADNIAAFGTAFAQVVRPKTGRIAA